MSPRDIPFHWETLSRSKRTNRPGRMQVQPSVCFLPIARRDGSGSDSNWQITRPPGGAVTGNNVAVCATISADSFADAPKCCIICNIPATQDRLGDENVAEHATFHLHIPVSPSKSCTKCNISTIRSTSYLWDEPLTCAGLCVKCSARIPRKVLWLERRTSWQARLRHYDRRRLRLPPGAALHLVPTARLPPPP